MTHFEVSAGDVGAVGDGDDVDRVAGFQPDPAGAAGAALAIADGSEQRAQFAATGDENMHWPMVAPVSDRAACR